MTRTNLRICVVPHSYWVFLSRSINSVPNAYNMLGLRDGAGWIGSLSWAGEIRLSYIGFCPRTHIRQGLLFEAQRLGASGLRLNKKPVKKNKE